MKEVTVMPLPIAPVGRELTVKRIGLDDKTKKHLESLGITIGSKLTIMSSGGGNLIITILSGRLCLDSSISSKILVA